MRKHDMHPDSCCSAATGKRNGVVTMATKPRVSINLVESWYLRPIAHAASSRLPSPLD